MFFANIEYLFLLLLLIPYIVWYILKRKKTEATLQISDARVYAHTPKSYKNYLLHAPFILRVIALALIIVVLARPQSTNKWQNSEIEGIDIMNHIQQYSMVHSQRALSECFSGKQSDTNIIIRASVNKFGCYIFSSFQSVWLQVFRQHTGRHVDSQHNINSLYFAVLPLISALRTR